MRSRNEHNDDHEADPYAELSLLSEVRRTPDTTQRGLASRLGISLGLTNILLRNLARKGYVRVAQADWRRRLYALTPQGMVRRVLLTGAYVNRVLDHYQKVKLILREELEPLSLHAESRIAILGVGEFAELVYLGLKEFGIEEMDVFDTESEDGRRFLGMPIRDVAALQPEQYDRVVVAMLDDLDASCTRLQELGVPQEHLVTFFGVQVEKAVEEPMMDADMQSEEE